MFRLYTGLGQELVALTAEDVYGMCPKAFPALQGFDPNNRKLWTCCNEANKCYKGRYVKCGTTWQFCNADTADAACCGVAPAPGPFPTPGPIPGPAPLGSGIGIAAVISIGIGAAIWAYSRSKR